MEVKGCNHYFWLQPFFVQPEVQMDRKRWVPIGRKMCFLSQRSPFFLMQFSKVDCGCVRELDGVSGKKYIVSQYRRNVNHEALSSFIQFININP